MLFIYWCSTECSELFLRMVENIKIKSLILGCLQASGKEKTYTWENRYQYLAKYDQCDRNKAERNKAIEVQQGCRPCEQHDLRNLLGRNGMGVEM